MRKKVDFVCLFNEHVMFNMHYNKLTSIIYYVNYKVTGYYTGLFLLAASLIIHTVSANVFLIFVNLLKIPEIDGN